MQEIRVKVTASAGRKFLIMYYDDPLTGKRQQRSTKQTRRREAEREAAKWEAELREGRYRRTSKITWEEFRDEFYTGQLANAAAKTLSAYETAFNAVDRHLKIVRIADLNTAKLTHLAKCLQTVDKISPESVRSYLGHLRAALNWAHRQGMLPSVPAIDMPKRVKGQKLSKGRPITGEEFDRMLTKIEAGLIAASQRQRKGTKKRPRSAEAIARRMARHKAEAAAAAPAWRRLLEGLRLSGLRLGEAVSLTWDDETKITVDLSGRRPMLRIPSDCQKNGQETVLPMTPDFAAFLQATPPELRYGPVFVLPGRQFRDAGKVGRVISAIGEAAGVVVDKASGKFASAHDLRRTFGFKWSARVMPAVLKELMRHSDISTTMRYYVNQSAEETADVVWQAAERFGTDGVSTFVSSEPKTPSGEESGVDVTRC